MEYKYIAGVDEVGRGPLFGPVVSAAVILPKNHSIVGLADSKKISEKKRKSLYNEIIRDAICYAIAEASAEEIDQLNILQATLLSMSRAISKLSIKPNFIKIDGSILPKLDIDAEAIIQGDSKVDVISAASILAKVYRDDLMLEYDHQYPQYGFAKHKGYPTKLHLECLNKNGVIEGYRKTFKPIKKILKA
jgi:ribonuclease HII